jgi:hypothetical protein
MTSSPRARILAVAASPGARILPVATCILGFIAAAPDRYLHGTVSDLDIELDCHSVSLLVF